MTHARLRRDRRQEESEEVRWPGFDPNLDHLRSDAQRRTPLRRKVIAEEPNEEQDGGAQAERLRYGTIGASFDGRGAHPRYSAGFDGRRNGPIRSIAGATPTGAAMGFDSGASGEAELTRDGGRFRSETSIRLPGDT